MIIEYKGDMCAPNPCSNGGTCISNGYSVKCSCREGFKGDLCQICDACTPNPCKNNGVCLSDGLGSFVCRCPAGVNGRLCESMMGYNQMASDPCNPNPCHNNGNCIPTNNGFQCMCPNQYSGKTCAVYVHTQSKLFLNIFTISQVIQKKL
jgi:hypothetical protein